MPWTSARRFTRIRRLVNPSAWRRRLRTFHGGCTAFLCAISRRKRAIDLLRLEMSNSTQSLINRRSRRSTVQNSSYRAIVAVPVPSRLAPPHARPAPAITAAFSPAPAWAPACRATPSACPICCSHQSCDDCGHDYLVAFSCKGRGVCPSCNTRSMAQAAAHLSDHVFPRLPVRQWVLSVPKRLRYYLQRDNWTTCGPR